MKILLTRSRLQNALMKIQLESSGKTVVEMPLIEQKFLVNSDEELAQFLQNKRIQSVVFISPSSVEFGAKAVLTHLAYGIDVDETVQVFAVGRGTAMMLQSRFSEYKHVIFPNDSAGSEALLKMVEMQNIQGKQILIVTGAQGKPYLEQKLISRGADVSKWECYERTKPHNLENRLNSEIDDNASVIFLHSAHAAKHFIESITESSLPKTEDMHAIVGAQSIEQELRRHHWMGFIHQAASPMPKDMMECFETL